MLDPFAGSGTILRAAWERFGVQTCLGYEVDGEALRLARRTVGAPRTRLVHDSFEACRPERLPPGTRLVSNLPFGARYPEVPLRRLGPFLERCLERVAGMALLISREQGRARWRRSWTWGGRTSSSWVSRRASSTPGPCLRVRRQKLKTPKAHRRPATTTTAITTPMM